MSTLPTFMYAWLSARVVACSWIFLLFFSVGILTAARFLLKTSLVLAQTFVISGKNLKEFGATKGAWAVVTGASDGIGKEFALQLADAGFSILLVARNEAALGSVAAEIERRTAGKVETRIQLIDFSRSDPAALSALKSVLRSLDIGVLVNNVGKAYAMPTYFIETTEQENVDIVTINITAAVRVTHAVLPGMIKRKCCLILNVGSFVGQVPCPMLSTYSGTKGFLSTFTSALADEIRPYNIIIQDLNTWFVISNMSRITKSSMSTPTASAYVRSVLRKVGLSCGAALTNRPDTLTPFWGHAMFDYVIHAVGSKAFWISSFHRIMKNHRRTLQASEREAKQL